MKRRPLSLAVLIVVMILWLLPAEIWMEDPDSAGGSALGVSEETGPPEFLTGQVWRLESRETGQTVYLKHSNLSDTGIILVYLNAEYDLSIGNTLLIKQPYELEEPEPPGNPGQFDARLYYRTQGIVLFCYAQEVEIVDESVSPLPEFLRRLKEQLKEQCGQVFGEKESGMMQAMLLGDKAEILPEVKSIYSRAGISHLIALSGLHLAIVGMSLYRILRKLGCSYWMAGLPTMGLVWLYGSLTGMGISTARAVIMCLLMLVAEMLGKSYDMLTALAAAALLFLAEEPLYARNAAFLLSFGAVLGIGLLYPALRELFPVPQKILQTCLLNLSIQGMTLPILQLFYYECAVYSVLLNLLVVPLMSILLPAGIVTLTFSFISLSAAQVPALLCKGILNLYEWLGSLTLQWPGAVFICGQPALWQIITYYVGIAGFVYWRYRVHEREKWRTEEEKDRESEEEQRERHRKKQRDQRIGLLLFLVLNVVLFLRFHRGLEFTMLDVGQGDCLFLRTAEGTTCLIDGGSSDVSQVGTYRIIPFLKSQGVRKLDYVFVTHMDADHISGLEELLEQAGEAGSVRIGTLIVSGHASSSDGGQEFKRTAEERGIQVQTFHQGMILQERKTQITCLYPEEHATYVDQNAGSLVLHVEYLEFSLLLTGDLEETGEAELLKKRLVPDCDILKVGHHGSRFSTSPEWLEKVQPEVALISCGEKNSYGHPHGETLERLESADSVILGTPDYGAVTIQSDGKRFQVEGFKQKK